MCGLWAQMGWTNTHIPLPISIHHFCIFQIYKGEGLVEASYTASWGHRFNVHGCGLWARIGFVFYFHFHWRLYILFCIIRHINIFFIRKHGLEYLNLIHHTDAHLWANSQHFRLWILDYDRTSNLFTQSLQKYQMGSRLILFYLINRLVRIGFFFPFSSFFCIITHTNIFIIIIDSLSFMSHTHTPLSALRTYFRLWILGYDRTWISLFAQSLQKYKVVY